MLKTALLLFCFMLVGAQARAAASFDELFVRSAAQGSIYELALAQLGQSRATRTAVKTYAATLVNDHEAYNGALRDLADVKAIAMPSVMATSDRKRLDRLTRSQGRVFDTALLREIRRVNGQNIRSFRKELSRTSDPDIRRFVDRFLPVDEEHEAGALALMGRDVASRGPVIQPPQTGDPIRVSPPPGDSAMPVVPPRSAAPR